MALLVIISIGKLPGWKIMYVTIQTFANCDLMYDSLYDMYDSLI